MTWYYTWKIQNLLLENYQIINKFGKVAVYKINTQQSVTLYTLTIKNQGEKLRKKSYLSLHQKEYNI